MSSSSLNQPGKDGISDSTVAGFWRSKISVSLPVFAIVILLALFLTAVNLSLAAKNRLLRKNLQTLIVNNFAPVGALLPTLSGRQPDGAPIAVDPAGSAPLLLLVFEPTCAICDQNWPNWARLTSDSQISRQCLLVSGSSTIPPSYLEQHHSGRRSAILGLPPDVLKSFNLLSTPQTILVEKGKIIRSWPGVLSKADMEDIRSGLISVSEAYR